MDLIIKDTKADFNEYFDICNASDETKEKFEKKIFLLFRVNIKTKSIILHRSQLILSNIVD